MEQIYSEFDVLFHKVVNEQQKQIVLFSKKYWRLKGGPDVTFEIIMKKSPPGFKRKAYKIEL